MKTTWHVALFKGDGFDGTLFFLLTGAATYKADGSKTTNGLTRSFIHEIGWSNTEQSKHMGNDQ